MKDLLGLNEMKNSKPLDPYFVPVIIPWLAGSLPTLKEGYLPRETVCGKESPWQDRSYYVCALIQGHGGAHIGYAAGGHSLHAWDDDEDTD